MSRPHALAQNGRRSLSPSRVSQQGSTLQRWANFVLGAALSLTLGALLGLALTAQALRHDWGVGAVRIGAWSFAPDAGSPGINPYLRARFAQTGQVPMAAAEGVMLVAASDDRGARLDRACTYQIGGTMPQARFWTLEAADPAGAPLAGPARRSGFTSAEILRDDDGQFTIVVAAAPQPGNWLPVAGAGRLLLVLRLYDTTIAALGTKEIRKLPMPSITAQSCG